MKKIFLIGLCIVLVILVAGSYKLNLFTLLNEYEEKCYQYKVNYWNETYCESSIGLGNWKNTNEERPCCSNESSTSIWGHNGSEHEYYWCMGFPYNKTFWKFTDECAEYHLVRKPT